MKWGQWGVKYSTPQYLQLIEECIAANITSFDHADIYGDYTVEEAKDIEAFVVSIEPKEISQ